MPEEETVKRREEEAKISPSNGQQFPAWREFGLVALGYSILTIILTYPVVFNLTTKFMGDGGDGLQNVWNMWWFKKALLELHTTPYHTSYLHYPMGHTLLFQSLNPFNCLISIPFQYIFSMVTVYNLIVLFSFAASGVGMYYLVRYLTKNRLAAFVSGIIFTFCPYHFAHGLGHLQLIAMEWLPVYTLFIIKTFDEGGVRNAILAGIFLVLTALCSWYYLVYAACLTVLLAVVRPRQLLDNKRRLSELVLAIGVFWMIMGPLLGVMIHTKMTEKFAEGHNPDQLSADLVGFLVPNEISSYGKYTSSVWKEFPGNKAEDSNYIGYVVLGLAVFSLIKVKKSRFWGVAGLIFMVLAMGPYLRCMGVKYPLPMPYQLLHNYLPLFNFSGVPERFDIMLVLCLAVMAGYGISAFLDKPGRSVSKKTMVTAAIAVAIMLEHLAIPFPTTKIEVPPFYREMARDGEDYAVLDLPVAFNPKCLYFASIHGKPIIGGYMTRLNVKAMQFFAGNPLLAALRGWSEKIRLPVKSEMPRYARGLFKHYNIRYLIVRDEKRSDLIKNTLKLKLIDSRGGILVYDCRG